MECYARHKRKRGEKSEWLKATTIKVYRKSKNTAHISQSKDSNLPSRAKPDRATKKQIQAKNPLTKPPKTKQKNTTHHHSKPIRLSPPIAEGEGRGKRRRKKDGKPRRAWLGVGQRGNVEK
ncbi:MAG: hypothetical protein ACK5UE_07145 [Chitinophagales bacterium]